MQGRLERAAHQVEIANTGIPAFLRGVVNAQITPVSSDIAQSAHREHGQEKSMDQTPSDPLS